MAIADGTADHKERAPSTAQLLSALSDQTTTLVRQEFELAKAELAQRGKHMGLGASLLTGAGLVATLGLAMGLACIAAALALVLPVWLATLIPALLLFGLAGALAVAGLFEVRRWGPPKPQGAIDSAKEDVAWLRIQAKSAKP